MLEMRTGFYRASSPPGVNYNTEIGEYLVLLYFTLKCHIFIG